ncbi:MAG TPA: taurine catabolism dioxygenase TauD [Advenella kashmirensis]|uniref:Taurine catabolism dioxygenase TauD n=1 Tax=Advenella kashmirensis TaxID=310575 RepID=A0A356LD00_9BURK|nr:taurine catabolism dioxygenase TauD [Advenella kashmirensis]
MNNGTKGALSGPEIWTGAQLADRQDWIESLEPQDIAEIDAMLRAVQTEGAEPGDFTADDFFLPRLKKRFEAVQRQLEEGRGFLLIRGLPVERYTLQESRIIFWALALLTGQPQAQDRLGSRMHSVTNTNLRVEGSDEVRSYQTDDELTFHNDGGDAFMLLCLKTARSGGMSKLVSVGTIYNEVLRHRPDLIDVLQQPFHFDARGQHPSGLKVQSVPIFNFFQGKLSALYKRRYLLAAQRFDDVPRLTEAQQQAIDLVEQICNDPATQLGFYMKPGDIQIANNYSVLHARTKYEDFSDPLARRHLLRIWLTLPNGRALPPVFAQSREFGASYQSRYASAAQA